MWLSVQAGALGNIERSFTRREMLAADQAQARIAADAGWSEHLRAKAQHATFAIPVTDGEHEAAHYPDLMLVVPHGRIAVELALTIPGHRELERILAGYGTKPSVAVVLYLTERGAVLTRSSRPQRGWASPGWCMCRACGWPDQRADL
jgi:hypothetical protein